MMSQEKVSPSVHEAPPVEVERIIIEWIKATEAFHHRYANLIRVINKLETNPRRQSAQSKSRLRKLLLLRQHMGDVLMTLMMDMNGQRPSQSAMPSKPGQLRSHAYLLDELNQKIDAELMQVTTVAQA